MRMAKLWSLLTSNVGAQPLYFQIICGCISATGFYFYATGIFRIIDDQLNILLRSKGYELQKKSKKNQN